MSHQDQVRGDALETHAQDLYKAFQWLTPARCFDSIRFRDDCRWSPRMLVFAAPLWSWCDFQKLGKRYSQAQKIMRWLFSEQQASVSYQAFMDMLNRWTDRLLACLLPAYRRKLQQALADNWQIGKWLVFAVDGSRVNVPQIWMTLLWHVASGLPWAWRLGPSDSSERSHLQEMLGDMPTGALLTADAGFVGYDLWNKMLELKLNLLIRVGSNVRLLKNLGEVKRQGDVVHLWPDRAIAKNLPPLVLRLIVLGTGKHAVYLVTNLTAKQLSNHQAAEIYRRRWGLEVFFRHCKQTYDRAKLRSKNPDNTMVELQWSLMSMCVLGLYSHAQLARQGVPPEKISFAGVLEAFRDPLREYRLPPDRGESMKELIAKAVLDDYVRKDKSSRYYPMQKQHKPPSPPVIVQATAEQRRKLKQLNHDGQKGLTA